MRIPSRLASAQAHNARTYASQRADQARYIARERALSVASRVKQTSEVGCGLRSCARSFGTHRISC